MYKKIVETWGDIEREIEKEMMHLEWQEYKPKGQARQEAADYVYTKYKHVIDKLKGEGKSAFNFSATPDLEK